LPANSHINIIIAPTPYLAAVKMKALTFFNQAKQALPLPENATLQSAYQFGVQADLLATLVV